eukprot:INCI13935.3.p1 GENE.INCI13935.3~~INCI13935.3.p1  ORF type:complete len:1700 (+),score=443.82 INCI13935.3:343-5442(+)
MERYTVKKTLGEGGFGKALLAERIADGELVVIKTINVHGDRKELEEAKREAKFLESLDHRNIVQYVEDFMHKGDFCIVMEHACGGDLHQKIRKRRKQRKPLSEKEIMHVFVQICEALKECHSRNILHRDLKSQNIFLDIDRETKGIVVKLGDFGIARSLSSTRALARTQIGTPFYLSPEICNDKAYNHKTDIWALGCLLYEMCALKVPFEARDMPGLIRKIIYGRQPALTGNWSRGIKNLIAILLRKDPKRRPTIDAVLTSAIVRKYKQQVEEKRATMSAAQMKAALGSGGSSRESDVDLRRHAAQNQRDRDAARGQPQRSSADDAARRQRIREREQAALDAHQRKREIAEANRKMRDQQRQEQRAAWGGPANGNGGNGSGDPGTPEQIRKERDAQAKATEAIKAKWAAERKAFIEGGGHPQQQQHQQQQQRQQDTSYTAAQQHDERPLTAKERREQQHLEMLKQARIQAFQDRQRIAAAHGRGGGHYTPPSDVPSSHHQQAPIHRAPSFGSDGDLQQPSVGERQMSAKEKREFDKLELLKQARIAAFQDRMRMAEKHRRGGQAAQHHRRMSDNLQRQDQERQRQEQERQRQEREAQERFERDQYEQRQQQAYEQQAYERQQYERQLYERQQQQQQQQQQAYERQQYELQQRRLQNEHFGGQPPNPSFEREEDPGLPAAAPRTAEEEKLELLRQARIQAFQDRQRMAAKHGNGRNAQQPQSSASESHHHRQQQPEVQQQVQQPPISRQQSKEEQHLEMLKQARIAAFEERKRLREQFQGGGRGVSRTNPDAPASAAPAQGRNGSAPISRQSSQSSAGDAEADRLEVLRRARIEAFEERQRLEARFRAARGGGTGEHSDVAQNPQAPPIPRAVVEDERPLPAQRRASHDQASAHMSPEERKMEALRQARIEAFEERKRLQARYGKNDGATAASSHAEKASAPGPSVAADERPLPTQHARAPGNPQGVDENPASQPNLDGMSAEERKVELLRRARIEAFEERKRLRARYGGSQGRGGAQPQDPSDQRPLPAQKRNPADERPLPTQRRDPANERPLPTHRNNVADERPLPTQQKGSVDTGSLSPEEQQMEALRRARIEAFEERKRLQARYGGNRAGNSGGNNSTDDAVKRSTPNLPAPTVSDERPLPTLQKERPRTAAAADSDSLTPQERQMEALRQARIEAFEERKRLQQKFKGQSLAQKGGDSHPTNLGRTQPSSPTGNSAADGRHEEAQTSSQPQSASFAPENETPHEKQLRLLKEARIAAFQERQKLARKYGKKDSAAGGSGESNDSSSPAAAAAAAAAVAAAAAAAANDDVLDTEGEMTAKQRARQVARQKAFALARQKRAEKEARRKAQLSAAPTNAKPTNLQATRRSPTASANLGATQPSQDSASNNSTSEVSGDLGATQPSQNSSVNPDLGATRKSPDTAAVEADGDGDEELTFEVHTFADDTAEAEPDASKIEGTSSPSKVPVLALSAGIAAQEEPEQTGDNSFSAGNIDEDLDIRQGDVDEIPGTPFENDGDEEEDEDNWLLEEDESGPEEEPLGDDAGDDSDATVEAADDVGSDDDFNDGDDSDATAPAQNSDVEPVDGALAEAQKLLEDTDILLNRTSRATPEKKQGSSQGAVADLGSTMSFAFTSPPPAVISTDSKTVDELREYLEKHVGTRALLKFYRLSRKSGMDAAAAKAMSSASGVEDMTAEMKQ